MLITGKLTIELVKFPSWGLSTLKAFVNKCLFKPKRGFLLELGLLAAGRLAYLEPSVCMTMKSFAYWCGGLSIDLVLI